LTKKFKFNENHEKPHVKYNKSTAKTDLQNDTICVKNIAKKPIVMMKFG
jgi:hypothetical protein